MSTQINDLPETKNSPLEADNPQLASRDRTHGGRIAGAPDRPGAEHYDTLLWRIAPRLETAGGMGLLLGLTSSDRQAGVSTVAANLAIRAADHKLGPVLLADCNFRHPTLHTLLRKERLRIDGCIGGPGEFRRLRSSDLDTRPVLLASRERHSPKS